MSKLSKEDMKRLIDEECQKLKELADKDLVRTRYKYYASHKVIPHNRDLYEDFVFRYNYLEGLYDRLEREYYKMWRPHSLSRVYSRAMSDVREDLNDVSSTLSWLEHEEKRISEKDKEWYRKNKAIRHFKFDERSWAISSKGNTGRKKFPKNVWRV